MIIYKKYKNKINKMATLSINIHNTYDHDLFCNKRKCPGAPRHKDRDHYQFSFHDFYKYIPDINISLSNFNEHNFNEHQKYKTCPSPPHYSKKVFDQYGTHDFPSEEGDFCEKIENMYRKVENSYVVKNDIDNNYIPDGTRILVGKKFYKLTDRNHKIINMKQIFLLIKSFGKWKRSNIVLERSKDESHEWDISFD